MGSPCASSIPPKISAVKKSPPMFGMKSSIERFPTLKLSVDGSAVPLVQAEQRTKKASSSLKVGMDRNIKPGVNPSADMGRSLGLAAIVQVNAGWKNSAGANCAPSAEFS